MWEILKMEFQGDSQVNAVKLQGLTRDFENLSMKEGEAVGDYFGRVMALVSQKRAYSEIIADRVVVEKILRSLTSKFDYVIHSIEINNDLASLTPVKLMGCLQSQEERINSRTPEKSKGNDEHALQTMQDSKKQRSNSFRGRGRLSMRGRGRGRFQDNSKIPCCTHCNKHGHYKKDCWYNDDPAATVATENKSNQEDAEKLFMALTNAESSSNDVHLWFLDSGASNHMTGAKECFTKLESFKISVKLGDKKELEV
ncbi:uncharacterized protein LOC143539371 [Bidens hawaiensis]|uniref:uncharacterized protein LOC143539371 n=1 Tax=Bidens hawaiensis TaxID=980011 RepID=UPI004049AF71